MVSGLGSGTVDHWLTAILLLALLTAGGSDAARHLVQDAGATREYTMKKRVEF
jgi:hypothetical protein